MEIEIDISDIMALVARVQGGQAIAKEEIRTAVRQSGYLMQRDSQSEAPVDTGNLKNLIGPPEPTDLMVKVTSHADYSKPVHDGASAHVIKPKAKKALYWPGAAHPVRMVNHPGNKANPYMVRGLRAAKPDILRVFEQAGQRIGRRLLMGG